jgi:glycosyltransferase involved in cell wall biosynthesis
VEAAKGEVVQQVGGSGLKLLLAFPQLPQDPASGAARSTRTIAEMLANSEFDVRVVATTATELAQRFPTTPFLAGLGIAAHLHRGTRSRPRPELSFEHRRVHYRLLDVGPRDMHSWQKLHNRQFDRMFDDEIHSFRPDILLCYGGLPVDAARYERARRQGVRLVFALHNAGYLSNAEFFRVFDAVLTPSRYLSGEYLAALGIQSTPLPVPIELEDVVAEERDPVFTSVINPSLEKGLMFVARLAEEISLQRPDLAMLFIESRGSAGRLIQAGLAAGFDLRRHENLMFSPSVAQPRDIYAATRVLLVPSLWNEPAGRVAAEALLNGIPPLVSNRGGLAEICNGAGFVLPIPAAITPRDTRPVDPPVVQPWINLIARLEDDKEFYMSQSELAHQAGRMYDPNQLTPRYAGFFQSVANGGREE